MCVCECLEQATYPAHTYLAYLMVKFCLPHHVGHVVESRVFPVGGALIGEQPVSVCVRKTSRSWLSPPTPRRAPPSGKKTQEFTVRLETDGTIMSLALVLTGMRLVCLKYDFSRVWGLLQGLLPIGHVWRCSGGTDQTEKEHGSILSSSCVRLKRTSSS